MDKKGKGSSLCKWLINLISMAIISPSHWSSNYYLTFFLSFHFLGRWLLEGWTVVYPFHSILWLSSNHGKEKRKQYIYIYIYIKAHVKKYSLHSKLLVFYSILKCFKRVLFKKLINTFTNLAFTLFKKSIPLLH